ncbi:hypothetical protein A3I51_04765 [Candidatus Gottesmanbacteria bacterium RIFCSPLOWO2_02_FULL_38_8]|uniref:Uncharacterized protein n=2 Tax=Candidatus Gottesmaniibacteriota TaxID=1752720 RepID=A0A1F6B1T8_9BACT|nr:MAG: hypothetical protein A3I51_04765 [Candidatus Gottesmanbacteria bacterium RIFCSPLOWO2_02_FULL_38_8]
MKLSSKLFILMVILSFGFLIKSAVVADWWDRGNRPVIRRNEYPLPTEEVQPTSQPQPTNPPAGLPSVTPPPQGGPEVIPTSAPTSSTTDEDPCASDKSYTGDYCGWSPRVGGEDGVNGGEAPPYETGTAPVLGLSYTAGEEVGLSDIMLLGGLLCLSLYAKSKFAPMVNTALQGRRKSR